jgi:hypothetical protein
MKKLLSVALSVLIAACTFTGIPLFGDGDTALMPSAAITSEAASSAYKDVLPYYCSLMTSEELRLYLQLRQAVMENKQSVVLMGKISEESYTKLINTLFYYDPLTFNLEGAEGIGLISKREVRFNYGIDRATYKVMLSEMEAVSTEINAKFTSKTSDYKKIKYIYDYIIKNTVYTESGSFSHYAYGAMCDGEAVCEGYASAFSYLCMKAGITAVNIKGEADGVAHMWNKVLCSGKWYCLDATWDDPVTNYRGYAEYSYFLISDELMDLTHTQESSGFDLPAATDNDGSYYAKNNLVATDITSAKKLLISQVTAAAKKGKLTATISFKDRKTYDSVIAYFDKNNSKAALSILSSAKKKSGVNIITQSMWKVENPNCLTYTVCILYEDSDISDYFYNPSLLDKDTLKYFKGLGINVKTK